MMVGIYQMLYTNDIASLQLVGLSTCLSCARYGTAAIRVTSRKLKLDTRLDRADHHSSFHYWKASVRILNLNILNIS